MAELVDASRIGRNYNVDVRRTHISCRFESCPDYKIKVMKTEIEIKIEKWWDNLSDLQQDWLANKFFKDDKIGINTLQKVVHCYNSLTSDELLELSGLRD